MPRLRDVPSLETWDRVPRFTSVVPLIFRLCPPTRISPGFVSCRLWQHLPEPSPLAQLLWLRQQSPRYQSRKIEIYQQKREHLARAPCPKSWAAWAQLHFPCERADSPCKLHSSFVRFEPSMERELTDHSGRKQSGAGNERKLPHGRLRDSARESMIACASRNSGAICKMHRITIRDAS